jgi:hypothetical protein
MVRMKRRFLFLILGVLALTFTACASMVDFNHALPTSTTDINIKVPAKVIIHEGVKKPYVIFYGKPSTYYQSYIQIGHGQLNILPKRQAYMKGFHASTVIIGVRYLHNLSVNGSPIVVIHAAKKSQLNLLLQNVPRIRFTGNATISNLFLSGSGNFLLHGHITLGNLVHTGAGHISIKKASGQLSLHTMGPGDVDIRGNFALNTLFKRGAGNVNLQGTGRAKGPVNIDGAGPGSVAARVNTKQKFNLTVTGTGRYTFSGRAARLNIVANNQTQVYARYLRAYRAYIKTAETAVVTVNVQRQIFAYANDCSRINYFGHPPLHYVNAQTGSSILPLSP